MQRSRRSRSASRGRILGVAVAWVAVLGAVSPAGALELTDISTPVTGNASWFYSLGAPYGGCGLPQAHLDTPHFVALNVYNLPEDYSTFHHRPMAPEYADVMGLWDNGHNCGRWVEVTIGDFCKGTNDGGTNQPFCRDGEGWVQDEYNGATLNMIVADSCGDGNAWCRDDPYHLDLSRHSLNMFLKDGVEVGDMDPDHWNNRHISWKFIPAPDYTGDIRLGFLQSAMPWWPAIAVSGLENGIHGVEYYQDGTWVDAEMNGDMGQSYIVGGVQPGGSSFQIRVRDVDDELINDGRVYSFAFPPSCTGNCNGDYTTVEYVTSVAPGEPIPVVGGGGDEGNVGALGSCTATFATTVSWPEGFQGEVTVTAGDVPARGWTVTWDLGDGTTFDYGWNASISTSGSVLTAKSPSYNATLAAGTSSTFGFVADGPVPAGTPTCTAG